MRVDQETQACHVNDITYLIVQPSPVSRRRLRSVTDVPIGSYARRHGLRQHAVRPPRVSRLTDYPLLAGGHGLAIGGGVLAEKAGAAR